MAWSAFWSEGAPMAASPPTLQSSFGGPVQGARRMPSEAPQERRGASEFDVAVVGGGLVGVATAWGLAREGCRVVVLDEGDRAVRASRGNFALVWVQSKGLGLAPYAGWTIRSS